MAKYLCILLVIISGTCQAQENYLKNGVNWLKQSLPEDTHVSFTKSRIKFNGCKHREYELKISQPVNEDLSLEGGLTYAKGNLNWGIHNQKISLMRFSMIPRYQVNSRMSLGAGVVYQSEPQFRTSSGFGFDLPKSQIWLVSTRFQGIREDHQIEVEFSSHRWEATNQFGSWFERGQTDNKVSLNYQAAF